jgi:hypothetical protein
VASSMEDDEQSWAVWRTVPIITIGLTYELITQQLFLAHIAIPMRPMREGPGSFQFPAAAAGGEQNPS